MRVQITAVLTRVNIPVDWVMAIGDNDSDVPVFDIAGPGQPGVTAPLI